MLINGSIPPYWVEFNTVSQAASRYLHQLKVSFAAESGINVLPVRVSNGTLQKAVYDPIAIFEGDSTNIPDYPAPGPNRVGYVELQTTRIGAYTLAGATNDGAVTDAVGGPEANLFTLGAGFIYTGNAVAPTIGEPSWVQFDLKQSGAYECAASDVKCRRRASFGREVSAVAALPPS